MYNVHGIIGTYIRVQYKYIYIMACTSCKFIVRLKRIRQVQNKRFSRMREEMACANTRKFFVCKPKFSARLKLDTACYFICVGRIGRFEWKNTF